MAVKYIDLNGLQHFYDKLKAIYKVKNVSTTADNGINLTLNNSTGYVGVSVNAIESTDDPGVFANSSYLVTGKAMSAYIVGTILPQIKSGEVVKIVDTNTVDAGVKLTLDTNSGTLGISVNEITTGSGITSSEGKVVAAKAVYAYGGTIDSTLRTAYTAADNKIITGYTTADTNIISAYKAADSAIISAYTAADSRLESEIQQLSQDIENELASYTVKSVDTTASYGVNLKNTNGVVDVVVTPGSCTSGNGSVVTGGAVYTYVGTAIHNLASSYTAPSGMYVNSISETDGKVSATAAYLPTLSKGTTSGSGNAVTDITVSGHTVTLTKGSTFLTANENIQFTASGDITGTASGQRSLTPTLTIGDNKVTESKINTGAVTNDKIGSQAVTEDKLGDLAVTTDKIDNGAVTSAKLDSEAVTSAKIQSGAITSAKIQSNAVTSDKIQSGAVTNDKLKYSYVGIGTQQINLGETANISTLRTDLGISTAMNFKGTVGTGGTVTTLPSNAAQGDTYKVITDGTYSSIAAKVGDVFIKGESAWVLVPSGDEPSGTVTSITIKANSPLSVDNSNAITTSGTRTISHNTSTVTAGNYGSTAETVIGEGDTFMIPHITVDAYGHITDASDTDITLPSVPTVSVSGTEKSANLSFGGKITVAYAFSTSGTKGHTISYHETTYTLPTETKLGLVKTTSTASPAHSGTFTAIDGITVNNHEITYNLKTVTLPAQYTHPSAGTATTYDKTSASSITLSVESEQFAVSYNGYDSKGHLTSVGTKQISIQLPATDPYNTARTPTAHTHGNITNDGKISSNVTIGTNDALVIADYSGSYVLAKSTITFDGSTTTKALTPKGTWETFNNYTHPTTTAVSAAAVKVGKDNLGHVVLGNSLTASDVGVSATTTSVTVGSTIMNKGTYADTAGSGTAGTSTATWKKPIVYASLNAAHVLSGTAAEIPVATSTVDGYMSSAYASKLNGIEAGANKYVHPTAAGMTENDSLGSWTSANDFWINIAPVDSYGHVHNLDDNARHFQASALQISYTQLTDFSVATAADIDGLFTNA